MTKKSVLAAALGCLLVPTAAMAEGYQINTLSARQQGMAHVGTAMKLGAESQFFNPAGMAFMDKTLDVSASITGIMATAKARHEGKTYETDNDVATPMMFDAAFSVYDKFKAGVAFYTPYGSSINWTDNWPGAVLNQRVSLKVFTIQPTFAYKILPNLSVGAGIMLTWGTVDLQKGLVGPASVDQLLAMMGSDQRFGATTPASVRLQGTATMKLGVNVGAMWDINPQWTVGASFRTQMNMKVKAGDASVTYANPLAEQLLEKLNVLNQANFKAEMPCPWVLALGATYKPVPRLTLSLDARLTGWSAYKTLDIEFLSEQLAPYDQHIVKDYKDAWAFSLGAQYALTNRFDVRAGMMVDTTPVNSDHYNPETPGLTKIEPTVGLSFRPISNLSIDFSLMYVAGIEKKGASCEYDDLLAKQMGQPYERTFTADYKVSAWVPSLGVSFSF